MMQVSDMALEVVLLVTALVIVVTVCIGVFKGILGDSFPFSKGTRDFLLDRLARHAMKGKAFNREDGLHIAFAPSSSEAINGDPVLESKHKIFLSHSGAQKEFVDHLCKALEEHCHYPFFDRRLESLPKGKKFPDLIFKAAEQCQLFVVVVSEEYFMSKWPMIELDAFVKATKKMKSSVNQGILPLFYGLSVNELKDEKRKQRWFDAWETFARKDVRGLIKVDDWKYALDELTKFNGLLYNQELKEVVEYEKEIVSHIRTLVTPDIKWEDSHVQGNVHEVVIEKMKQVRAFQLTQAKVLGLYGVGGIGKTTVCKKLCNELSNDFEGRVSHIEFDSKLSNSQELLQKVLIDLTRKSRDAIQHLDEGKCKDVLYKNLMKQKTFLAIDNVWDNANSIKQAMVFLKAPSHPDSLVLVTTRAQRTLELLRIDGGACLEMPELGQNDAKNLFLHHVANGQQFTREEDMRSIDLCVQRCYFSKGGGGGFHYHPLALEALGRQLGSCRSPFEWEEALSSIWNFNAFSGENEVFGVLRTSFDLLEPIEQDLFMDVAIFSQHPNLDPMSCHKEIILLDRLYAVYKKSGADLQSLLNSLKGKGLLQDVDLSLERINMHDLYYEFALLEAKKEIVEASSRNQRWVYVDVQNEDISQLEVSPAGGCWQTLTRLSIQKSILEDDESTLEDDDDTLEDDDDTLEDDDDTLEDDDDMLEDDDEMLEDDDGCISYTFNSEASIEWRYFSRIWVLQLIGLNNLKGTLNLTDMKSLRSLQIHDLCYIKRLEGLQELKNLTLFELCNFCSDDSKLEAIIGRFPKSLKYLDINNGWSKRGVLSGAYAFVGCTNLCKLGLEATKVGVQLDLTNCSSLEQLELQFLDDLKMLLLPYRRKASKLQSLNVGTCFNLVIIEGVDQLVGLEHLDFNLLYLKKVPNFLSLTNLQTLTMVGGRNFIDLHIPQFNHLQVLDLSGNEYLACISKMGDLPALQTLDLSNCSRLQRLPDLSKSRSLEKLDLDCCWTLELDQHDIEMLASLLLLRPMCFQHRKTKLDLRRRKVLHYVASKHPLKSSLNWMEDEWEEGEWEEKELGALPIKLRDF